MEIGQTNGRVAGIMMRSLGAVALLFAAPSIAMFGAEQSPPALSWQDHVEIPSLYATYTQSLDGGDEERWSETFTPDGVLLMVDAGGDEDTGLRIVGHNALAAFAANAHDNNGGQMRHWRTLRADGPAQR